VDVQSGILARMRELASQSASGIIDNVEQSIKPKFSALQEELSVTQDLLIKSVKTLNVTVENLSAADSTAREINFTEKVAALTQNRLHSTASVAKKE
jgi:flagellin-like hook-associated protein FlgL